MISVVSEGWTGDVHLARAGAHFPAHLKNEVEAARYAERLYRDRVYETEDERKDLTSLSKQHKEGCDMTSSLRRVRLNWDYDFKNEPVGPVCDVEGVICSPRARGEQLRISSAVARILRTGSVAEAVAKNRARLLRFR